MICNFRGSVGICGKHSLTDRCEKHKDKVEKPKRDLIGKWSGPSLWRKELGFSK